jgi:hypothetical protein
MGDSNELRFSYLNWMLVEFLGLSYILVMILILSLILIVYKFNEIKSI